MLRSALKEITGFSRTAGTVAVAVPDAAFAQAFDEANVLNQQVIRLNDQGRYSEAISLEQRVLAIQEKTLGPENPNERTTRLCCFMPPPLRGDGCQHEESGRYRTIHATDRQLAWPVQSI